MTDQHSTEPRSAASEDFAGQIADQVESLPARRCGRSRGEADGGRGDLAAAARGQPGAARRRPARRAASTSSRASEYQPDVGPDPDLDELRLRLAECSASVDTYSFVFDPYVPEVVREPALRRPQLSIATDLENGLRHYRSATSPRRCGGGSSPTSHRGATWPAPRSTRCWSVVAHDRLDADFDGDDEAVAVADEMLDERDRVAR